MDDCGHMAWVVSWSGTIFDLEVGFEKMSVCVLINYYLISWRHYCQVGKQSNRRILFWVRRVIAGSGPYYKPLGVRVEW